MEKCARRPSTESRQEGAPNAVECVSRRVPRCVAVCRRPAGGSLIELPLRDLFYPSICSRSRSASPLCLAFRAAAMGRHYATLRRPSPRNGAVQRRELGVRRSPRRARLGSVSGKQLVSQPIGPGAAGCEFVAVDLASPGCRLQQRPEQRLRRASRVPGRARLGDVMPPAVSVCRVSHQDGNGPNPIH
jgi:hypothetical protein